MKAQYKDSEFTLSMNEVERLINAADNFRDKVIIESLYYAALRRFEVAKMDIRDIDFERGRITVIGKHNKLSVIPVGAIFVGYMTDLRHYIGSRKEGPVFLSNRKKQLTIARINQILAETGEIAGLKNPNPKKRHINPHMLRHTLARHLKNLRFPLEFIQKYLRHSSIKTSMDEYGTLSLDEMERMVGQMKVIELK